MPEPDYFDRLLARRAGPFADVVRARPRLPGPFERAEPRWHEAQAAGPVRTPPAAGLPRVERHTEIRIAPPDPAVQVALPAPPGPRWLERPALATDLTPPARPEDRPRPEPAPAASARPGAAQPGSPRPGSPRPGSARPARPGPVVARAAPAIGPASPVLPMPRGLIAASARPAAPQPASRRRAKPAEPAVNIRIGRLEVRASADQPAARAPRPGRVAPAVNLSDYLTSGRGAGE
jgi:hypothetical protein